MPFQMALDEVCFQKICRNSAEAPLPPVLRFYFSSEPWVTIGRHTPLEAVTADLPICRRWTGGGVVFHGEDLIVSLAAHKSADPSFGSVIPSYQKIHEAFAAGFREAGAVVTSHPGKNYRPYGPDCFLFPIASDLEWKGRKIAGGAQKRSAGYFLHQESVQIPGGLEAENLIQCFLKGFREIFRIDFQFLDLSRAELKAAEELAQSKYRQIVPEEVK